MTNSPTNLENAERAEMEPKVKPLEFLPYPEDGGTVTEGYGEKRQFLSRAIPPTGGAIFILVKDGVYSVDGTDDENSYGSEAEAISAANATHASRIRSCLIDKPEAGEGDHAKGLAEKLEAKRAEQWRLRREAEASRDAARAAADSLRIERDALRAAIEPFAKLYAEIPEDNFWPSEEYKNLGIAAEAYALSRPSGDAE